MLGGDRLAVPDTGAVAGALDRDCDGAGCDLPGLHLRESVGPRIRDERRVDDEVLGGGVLAQFGPGVPVGQVGGDVGGEAGLLIAEGSPTARIVEV